jgi:hypothetical protein
MMQACEFGNAVLDWLKQEPRLRTFGLILAVSWLLLHYVSGFIWFQPLCPPLYLNILALLPAVVLLVLFKIDKCRVRSAGGGDYIGSFEDTLESHPAGIVVKECIYIVWWFGFYRLLWAWATTKECSLLLCVIITSPLTDRILGI